MKLVVAFLLVSCALAVLGDCPECDGLSSYYDLVGCKILCKRGKCPINYSCRKILIKLRAKKKCYFANNYYDVGFVLPGRYPAPNGLGFCSYRCIFGLNIYSFQPVDCQPHNAPPTPAECKALFQISGGFILQIQFGVIYRPEVCLIQLLPPPPLPPQNCNGNKCCIYQGHLYKVGTVINAFGFKCICLCPPLMSCLR